VAALQTREGLETAWVDIGVDDLTKYRIVDYLHQIEGDGAEVRSLATSLGFHSLEQTAATVEELYRSGLVWIAWEDGRPIRCGLTADPAGLATIAELFALGRVSNSTPELLARLARRSLDRAKARQPRKSGERGVGRPMDETLLATGYD
jgi:hypothetical protein